MANVRTRTWGPTHPSAAFLIKCAKEKEKLRISLQKQLQEHMLCMLEECLFSDTLISINSGKAYHAENPSLQNQHPDLPHISYAHKALLKVRVPAFYDHLCKHEEINLGVTSYNSFLEELQLKQFLRNVYTDDDIRKHECEALRNGKTHEEILRQRKAHFHEKQLVNKRIVDVDEFEKESVNSSCTDNFVTPKTSPLTPEKSIDVPDMFHPVQKKNSRVMSDNLPKLPLKNASVSVRNPMQNTHNIDKVITPSETPNQGEISEGYVSELDNTFDEDSKAEGSFGLAQAGNSKGNSLSFRDEINIASSNSEIKSSLNIENSYSPEIADNFPSPLGSDDASACKKTPSDLSDSSNAEITTSSSMVRSNTFDLNRQACLEDYIENNSLWENEESTDHNTDKSYVNSPDIQSYVNEKEMPKSSELETCSSFFLHNPSLKPNIFNGSYAKDMSIMAAHDSVENIAPSSAHFKRLDGSMSDSGFLSHSTFSMLSDAGIPGSITSSLILSSDGILSPSCTISQSNKDNIVLDTEASKRLSGSMFPFYIDINNLPSEQAISDKEEKPKSSASVYMFIDAEKPESQSVKERTRKSQSFDDKNLCSEYDEFNEKRHSSGKYPISHSGSYREHEVSSSEKPSGKSEHCYMYIDFDSVENKAAKRGKDTCTKPVPSSVSMFIDLNDDLSKTGSDQESPYHAKEENTNINRISDKKDSKLTNKYFVVDTDPHKQGNSDFVLSGRRVSDLNIQSHPLVHLEERSSSALDYQSFRRQNISGKNDILYANNSNNAMYAKADNLSQSIENFFSEVRPAKRSHSTLPANFKAKWMDDSNYVKSLDSKIISYAKKLCEVQSGNLFSTNSENKSLINSGNCAESKEKLVKEEEGDKRNSLNKETELLPMSPILRRKTVNKEPPKSPIPIVVKASTRPQDIDAMTFPRPDKKESPKLSRKLSQEDSCSESLGKHSSPSRKKLDHAEEPKSSNESLKLGSETLSESCDLNIKDKPCPDAMSRSGSSVMTVSGGETSSSGKHTPFDASKERLLQSSPSWSLSCDFEDDSETIYSEVSDVSSSLGGIASLERRWRERQNIDSDTREMHNVYRIVEACSKLGEDLLRMFLEGIDTDIVIEVEGKQIKAHRCILSARCKYFSAMLKGRWSESTNKIISLHGFSYSAVHFALCHIYSGALSLPKDINIAELALLADMLNLESLTDVIVFHLKMDYCHFFHRPCNQCTQGVVECLPLATSCGLNELRDKCIYWLGKYFTRTWPNKSFASLSEEFREQCYSCTLSHVVVGKSYRTDVIAPLLWKSINTVIEMIMNCDRLISTLPHMKWSEPVFGMVTRLLQDCIHFLSQNFNQILCCEGFLSLGKGQSWNVTALEDDLIAAVELMSPDVACKSYVKLNQILPLAEPDGGLDSGEFTQNFVDLLHKINRHCERYLIHNANKVVHCQSWAYLAPDVQKKIKDAAVIVFEFEKPTAPPPRLSSLQRKMKKLSESDEAICPERATYPRRSKTAPVGKFYQDQFSEKSTNKKEERVCPQRRELEIMMKKIVSPIKEEVNNHILESACREVAIEAISSFKKNGLMEKEEDSVKQPSGKGLPSSQRKLIDTQLSQGSLQEDSVDGICAEDTNSEDNRSTAHCSDNPDSLEANEETSCDSKDDLDGSISVEDTSYPEKADAAAASLADDCIIENRSQKEEDKVVLVKVKGTHAAPSLVPKSNTAVARENKVPILNPALPRLKKPSYCDTSSVSKTSGKSFVPLTKASQCTQETQTSASPKNPNKDLVAEIDADSRMVNHCLQEAEMLEQELSRKLQRQHQAVSTSNISHYIPNSPVRAVPSQFRTTSRSPRNAVQKSLSASHVKPTAARKRSPGSRSVSKPLTSSPSSPQVPRMIRSGDSVKDHKTANKKTSQKSNISTSQRSYRSMESITTVGHSRQQSVTSVMSTKRVSVRSRSSAIPSSHDGRTVNATR